MWRERRAHKNGTKHGTHWPDIEPAWSYSWLRPIINSNDRRSNSSSNGNGHGSNINGRATQSTPHAARASRAEIGGCAGVGVGGLLDNNEGQVLSRQCPNPEKHFFLPTILLSIFYAPLHLIFSSSFLFFLCFLCAVLSFSLSFAFALPHSTYLGIFHGLSAQFACYGFLTAWSLVSRSYSSAPLDTRWSNKCNFDPSLPHYLPLSLYLSLSLPLSL